MHIVIEIEQPGFFDSFSSEDLKGVDQVASICTYANIVEDTLTAMLPEAKVETIVLPENQFTRNAIKIIYEPGHAVYSDDFGGYNQDQQLFAEIERVMQDIWEDMENWLEEECTEECCNGGATEEDL